MKKVYVVTLLLAVTFLVLGCKKGEKYGQEISNYSITKTGDILKTPNKFKGKTITIEGEIINQCPTGCWFNLKDDKGVIYVDVEPSGFALPQKVGKTVTVEGKVLLRHGKVMIIGEGVELK